MRAGWACGRACWRAVLLCPLAAVTLPSVSKISAESSQDERPFIIVKQDDNMKLNDKPVTFATLKEEPAGEETTAVGSG